MDDLNTWKNRLKQKMDKLDNLWTPRLDEAWNKSSGEVEKDIGELAEAFFQYYWEVFDAFCKETSLEEWEKKASKSYEEASSQVAEAWEKVAEQAKYKAEKETVRYLRNLFAKTSGIRRNLRENNMKLEEGKKLRNLPNYEESITKFEGVTETYENAMEDFKDAREDVRGEWVALIVLALITILGSLYGIFQLISRLVSLLWGSQ